MSKHTELVLKAQEGDIQALEKLLSDYGYRAQDNWSNYLGKYLDLLMYGKINLKDKDTRRFLQLYIKDSSKRELLRNRYQNYRGIMAGQEVANYLQEKVKVIEVEDLKQELLLAFIECVNRFEIVKKSITFSGYLYNSYRFKVYEILRVNVFKNEVLIHPELKIEEQDTHDTRSDIVPKEWWFDRFYAADIEREELGLFWINGRCGETFSTLSTFERMLLRDIYLLGKTDGEFADEYGYHINTIFKNRHQAIKKIEQHKKETLQ